MRELDVRMAHARVDALARWWNAATQEARFQKLREAINGDPQAPTLRELKVAIILSEIEAGEVEEG